MIDAGLFERRNANVVDKSSEKVLQRAAVLLLACERYPSWIINVCVYFTNTVFAASGDNMLRDP